MILNFYECYRSAVFSDKKMIGYLVDLVINPDNGRIELLWIFTEKGLRIIKSLEVIRWNRDGLSICESDLKDPEVSNFSAIFKKEVRLLAQWVFDDLTKEMVGKVADLSIDTTSWRLLGVSVKKGFFFWRKKIFVPRDRIIKIQKSGLWIRGWDEIFSQSSKKSTKAIPNKSLDEA